MTHPGTGDVDDSVTVLRADLGAYRRWFGKPVHGLPLILALVGGGVMSALRRGEGAFLMALLVGTVIVTLAVIALLIATSRVLLTDDHIEQRRLFVRTRLRRDDVIGVLAELQASPVGRTSQVLVLRARSGGRRIWLNGAYWDQDDLMRVAQAADVPAVDGVLAPRDFERVAPGSMPWRTLHPWAAGSGGAVVILALVIGGVTAWWNAEGLPPFDDRPPRSVSASTIETQDEALSALQQTIGGEWESPDSRLVTCQDEDDYKGWSRRVSARLRETVIEDTGEDVIVTPVTPSREMADAIARTFTELGHPEPYLDREELADFGEDSYATIVSVPRADDPVTSTVEVTFYGRSGNATIDASSPCEVSGRGDG